MGIEPGTEIAGYRVVRPIGEGGMAVVMLAERLADGQPVVLKVMRAELGKNADYRRRFLRESGYAALLDHENVVKVFAAGEEGELLYIAMQYVEGTDLHKLLRDEGPLSPDRAITILGQVAAALDASHDIGLLHRDIKAANVLIAGDGAGDSPRAFLADFGLSKHTASDSVALTAVGRFVGTINYTAPEQILGTDLGPAVDVYSLGCLLYECLTGGVPFTGMSEVEVMQAHIERPPPPLGGSLPDGLDAVIAKALAKEPGERYASCGELIRAAAEAAGVHGAAGAADPVGKGGMDKLRLKVTAGNAVGTEIEVEDELLIGRTAEGEGRLAEDIEISRRHAMIARNDEGAFVVEDLGSTNGTIVNSHRIETPELLYPGDTIELGATRLVVQVTAGKPPAEQEPASEAATAVEPEAAPEPEPARSPASSACRSSP